MHQQKQMVALKESAMQTSMCGCTSIACILRQTNRHTQIINKHPVCDIMIELVDKELEAFSKTSDLTSSETSCFTLD